MNELVLFAAFASPSPPPDFSAFGFSGVTGVTPEKPKRVKVSGYWWDQFPDGTYEWCTACNGPFPANGVPGMVVVNWNGHKPAVPAVAAPTFRGPVHHGSHNCPVCGRAQYVVSGSGPVRGTHTHTCAAGHTWYH